MSGDHQHTPPDFSRAFAFGIAFNLVYVLVEAGIGLRIGSLALLADAGHNASDILGLVIAWVGANLALRPPSGRYTYGLRRSPIVASLFNALLLFGAMGIVAWEAIKHLGTSNTVPSSAIIWVASFGLIVNFGTAFLFLKGRDDLNIRGAYLHMFADGLVTLGVLVAGIVIFYTGWNWVDPAISLIVVAIVAWSTWGLFRDALRLSLDAAPDSIDVDEVRHWLQSQANVVSVHDLHIWAMSTLEVNLTAHVLVSERAELSNGLLQLLREGLHEQFEIRHSTIQLEFEQDGVTTCVHDCDSMRPPPSQTEVD